MSCERIVFVSIATIGNNDKWKICRRKRAQTQLMSDNQTGELSWRETGMRLCDIIKNNNFAIYILIRRLRMWCRSCAQPTECDNFKIAYVRSARSEQCAMRDAKWSVAVVGHTVRGTWQRQNSFQSILTRWCCCRLFFFSFAAANLIWFSHSINK